MAPFTEEERAAHALDWRILRDGGVSLYKNRTYLDADMGWFNSRGYKVISFSCERWGSAEEMHDDLAAKLSFPAYYGKNFNALNDCIQEDLVVPDNGGLALVLENFAQFCNRFPSANSQRSVPYGLLENIGRAIRFHLLLGRRLVLLIQTDDPTFSAGGLGGLEAQWNRHEWLCSARE